MDIIEMVASVACGLCLGVPAGVLICRLLDGAESGCPEAEQTALEERILTLQTQITAVREEAGEAARLAADADGERRRTEKELTRLRRRVGRLKKTMRRKVKSRREPSRRRNDKYGER